MNESPIDTLSALCRLTRKIPLHDFADRVGYHPRTIRYHLGLLKEWGLIRKVSCGYWKPTFEPPYDTETLYARVVIHKAAHMASEVPWLAERLLQLADEIPNPGTAD